MKKIFSLLMAIMVLTTASFAQAKQTEKKAEVKKESVKPAPTKKDGTPDMRYKENKEKKAETKPAGPLKKDGTPDKRYKENKDTKKKA